MTNHLDKQEDVLCICVRTQRLVEEVEKNQMLCAPLKLSLSRLEVALLGIGDRIASAEVLSATQKVLQSVENFVEEVIEKESNDLSSTIFTATANWLLGQGIDVEGGVQDFIEEIEDLCAQLVDAHSLHHSLEAVDAAREAVDVIRAALQQDPALLTPAETLLLAVEQLAAVSKGPQCQSVLVAAGAPELLVDLLQRCGHDSLLLTPAALALGRLSLSQQVTAHCVEENIVPVLLSLLQPSASENAQCGAAAGLSALVCGAVGRGAFVNLGGTGTVCSLLASASGDLQMHVTAILRRCFQPVSRDVSLQAADCIPGLVRALHGERRGTVENAAWLLWQYSSQAETRASVAAEGAVPELVRLLTEGSREAKVCAAGAVHSLSADCSYDALLAEAAVAVPLVQLLRDDSDEARIHAAAALKNLAVNADLRGALLDAGALPIVRRVLIHGTAEARGQAIGALHNLSVDEGASRAIAEFGFLQLVVEVLLGERGYAQESAAGVLRNVTADGESDALLLALGVVPVLVRMLDEGSVEGKGYAVGVLCNLCGDAEQVPAVVRAGALPLLVRLLRVEGLCEETRECVAEALCAIAEDTQYRAEMKALGVASAAEIGYAGEDVW